MEFADCGSTSVNKNKCKPKCMVQSRGDQKTDTWFSSKLGNWTSISIQGMQQQVRTTLAGQGMRRIADIQSDCARFVCRLSYFLRLGNSACVLVWIIGLSHKRLDDDNPFLPQFDMRILWLWGDGGEVKTHGKPCTPCVCLGLGFPVRTTWLSFSIHVWEPKTKN